MNILSAEWGSINNVRFVLSSRGSITPNASLLGANVFNMFVTAQESYTSVQLDGESAKFIYHPPGWGDDPKLLTRNSLTGVFKSFLIDMEALQGDMAQAKAA